MKITVEISDALLSEAGKVAARRRVTLRTLIEEGLRQVVKASVKGKCRPRDESLTKSGTIKRTPAERSHSTCSAGQPSPAQSRDSIATSNGRWAARTASSTCVRRGHWRSGARPANSPSVSAPASQA